MTAAPASADPVYAEIERLKAECLKGVAEICDQALADMEAQAAGNRKARRTLPIARQRMAAARRVMEGRIEGRFRQIVRDFDPETGTIEGVEEEARAALAGILKET